MLCGDECYYKKCLTDKIITGVSYDEEKSKRFIEKYSDNKNIPLLLHESDILNGSCGWKDV